MIPLPQHVLRHALEELQAVAEATLKALASREFLVCLFILFGYV